MIQMVHFILIYPVHLKVIWAVHLKCCNHDISLRELKVLQAIYGISVDALMFKAKTLGVISGSKYTSFCIKKNQYPDLKMAVEASVYKGIEESRRFERLVYRALASDIISCSKAAVLLNESMEEVKSKLELV